MSDATLVDGYIEKHALTCTCLVSLRYHGQHFKHVFSSLALFSAK